MSTLALVLALETSSTAWLVFFAIADVLALLSLPSVLIRRLGRPRAALAWTFGVLLVPYVGVLTWWLMGREHLHEERLVRQEASRRIEERLGPYLPRDGWRTEEARWLRSAGEGRLPGLFPATTCERLDLLESSAGFFQALDEAIGEARDHVHLMFFEWYSDETGRHFMKRLTQRAREGVEVRLLLDAIGCFNVGARMTRALREAGGQVAFFMPMDLRHPSFLLNFRNHRKVVVADGRLGLTGGLNVGDRYVEEYRDCGMRATGALVGQLQQVFVDDWYFTTGEEVLGERYFPVQRGEGSGPRAALLASGPHQQPNGMHDAFFLAITHARQRIWLATPFLTPTHALQVALRTAVLRGVDVRILVPRRSGVPLARGASWAHYPVLVESGVKIYEYLPSLFHSKLLVIDRSLTVVGSANVDNRSFRLSFECSCFVEDEGFARDAAHVFLRDLEVSRRVTREALDAQPPHVKLWEGFANLFGPLL